MNPPASDARDFAPLIAPQDLALLMVVVVVWGLNFAAMKVAVAGMPPFMLGCLRFILAAFPAVLFFRRPAVPLRWFVLYGMTISVGQFAFLFSAIYMIRTIFKAQLVDNQTEI